MNQTGDPATEASQALRLGRERHGAGAYREAAAYFREALRLREGTFGASDARTLDAVRHLAAAVAAMGDLEEAAELQSRALAGSSDVAHRLRSRLADDAAALARLQARRRDWDSAASLWLMALKERRASLGAGHADTLHALAQLATCWQSGGRVRRAERAWRRLLAAREATGAAPADIAAVRERIADCLAAQEQRGEALAMRLRAMGERDPAVTSTPADATRTARIPAEVVRNDAGGRARLADAAPDSRTASQASGSQGAHAAPAAGSTAAREASSRPATAQATAGRVGSILARVGAYAGSLPGIARAGGGSGDAPHGYRRLVLVGILLVLLLCAFAVVRYEMNRDGAVPEEAVEWYMEPPSQLGSPSTEVYTPN